MTKKEIVYEVSNRTGIEKNDVGFVVDTFIEAMKEVMLKGDRFTINDFVSLSVFTKKPTLRRNRFTKEMYEVPEKFAPRAIFSKQFKEDIAKSLGESNKG